MLQSCAVLMNCKSTKGLIQKDSLTRLDWLQNIILTERIVYFLNTVHCYNILEKYYYYEIQLHKALFDFAVDKGYCRLKEGLPPPDT
jgi:hypothetical protein